MDYILSPPCPQCKLGYLSHRSNEEDQREWKRTVRYHVERDFCSNPFCNYDDIRRTEISVRYDGGLCQ